jgi:hypothetical protein
MQLTRFALATASTVALLGPLVSCREGMGPNAPAPPEQSRAAQKVTSVTVSPAQATATTGETVPFTAAAYARSGQPITGATTTWASSSPSVATVSPSGVATAVGLGTATITATIAGTSGTATLRVDPAAAVLVGAGDIATCSSNDDEATAAVLDKIPGTVFTAGDNAYNDGTPTEFANCYAPSWGRHRARTHPVPGNHDYHQAGASGYFGYFGSAAGDPGKGYYSYDLGAWHIIALNSEIAVTSGSPQVAWLASDLAASRAKCTLAIWHKPRFSSGVHGSSAAYQPFWQALYDADADVVVSGHDHIYERFAPQTPTGSADPQRGIREFVAGTGGAPLRDITTVRPNSEFRQNTSHGVLKLALDATGYDWSFIGTDGAVRDAGRGSCH